MLWPTCCCVAGVPIPEEQAAAGQALEDATQQALSELQQQGVQGHEVGCAWTWDVLGAYEQHAVMGVAVVVVV